jgi:hypothetical protein
MLAPPTGLEDLALAMASSCAAHGAAILVSRCFLLNQPPYSASTLQRAYITRSSQKFPLSVTQRTLTLTSALCQRQAPCPRNLEWVQD